MRATREDQIIKWRKMRRVGKLRYVLVHSLGLDLLVAALMAFTFRDSFAPFLAFGIAFVLFAPISLMVFRGEWKTFENRYPDIE